MTALHFHLKAIIPAAIFVLTSTNTYAQAFDAVRLYGAPPGKDGGTVGAAVLSSYEYLGSDKESTLLLPVIDYQWANGWFVGVTNGMGYNFSRLPQVQFGLRMTANMGRRQSAASGLSGMGDIDAAVEGGAFFNYLLPVGVSLSSSVRYGAGSNRNGVVVDLGASYLAELSPKWHLGVGTGISLVNADYMQSFFGVSAEQSAASGHAAVSVGSGARDVRFKVAVTYSIDQRTSVTLALSDTHMIGNAKDSPLTRKATSESGVFAVTHLF